MQYVALHQSRSSYIKCWVPHVHATRRSYVKKLEARAIGDAPPRVSVIA